MLFCLNDMSVEEQKQIAFDSGRLAAWHGKIHIGAARSALPQELKAEWDAGVNAQLKAMSDAAAKVPLLFADERAKR